jgi:two-component system OmpR family sensor kinase/two-component system sensor histidine kinase BaeS
MNRLRVQLILAFTLVVLVAVGAIALLFVRTTDTHFRRYITNSGMRASGSGLQQLIAYYQEQGSWHGVDSFLGHGVFVGGPGMISMPGPNRRPGWPGGQLDVVLADADGRIVYDSVGKVEGKKLKSGEKSRALPITQTEDGEVIGYLLLSFPGDRNMLGRLEQQFLDQMQQILITGAALAVGVGLALGVLLSRRLTAPLQRLAAAARAVATGDLSQRVRVEGSTEMVEVAQAFNEMTIALGESERQRQNMVADAAHELRSPLTVLQGNLRAILDGVYPSSEAEIARLYDETRLLSRLVDDLRELALVDAGQLRLHVRPMNLVQVIQSTIKSLTPVAAAQEVSLTAKFPGPLPTVQADPDRVAQVLRNLLVNALRHTPGGSVTVTAVLKEGVVEVAVADTGEGIAAEDLPHLFDRFWRADPARARSGGTGLGLSVAQSLVEAQGGCMWAESSLGQGSAFRFTLPADGQDQTPEAVD